MPSTAVVTQSLTAFAEKIETRQLKVGVIGLGYVGLPLALLYSGQDIQVTGFDVDAVKVSAIQEGRSYIYRIPKEEIQEARQKGFTATADFAEISSMDAVIICVPTPLNEHHEPDLSFISGTAHAIAPNLVPGQLIVLESTTFPGTTEEILLPILERENRLNLTAARREDTVRPGQTFYVAFSPEREDPGNTLVARRDIPKVVGGLDATASENAAALYGCIFKKIVSVSSPAAAEMTKLLENIYRCVNIALINEMKLLCLKIGLDIWEIIDAAATKPFGFQPFYPGPGLGGHCIPVDPFYLAWKAKEWDFRTRFIELAGEINISMPYHIVSSITEAMNLRQKPINGANILILGVAYKKDVDDLRESPALTIIELLRRLGARVSYNDPYIQKIGKGRKYDLQMHSVSLDNLSTYDCVVVITDHSSYDFASIVESSQLVVDTRNATRGLNHTHVVRC